MASGGNWREQPLGSGELARTFKDEGLDTLGAAAGWIEALPYGRLSVRDHRAVLSEKRGTCSTKHALLVELMREEGVDAELVVGLFELSGKHFDTVAPVLEAHGLDTMLEAHCVAEVAGERVDFTGLTHTDKPIRFELERRLEPAALVEKNMIHRRALRQWRLDRGIAASFEAIWQAREACIAALSEEGA
ncbi:transglutaminase domain-containing protein [Sphingomicrobium aestuariivivum]|uniref:transglutaminase domain-containing protein n=1 Tax=Sphingomicrobium aestuariivivum TaxID=1582356 RepID=UPI001FD6D2AE|nr:transglutaminase domain-containing protein [Sphingomicrobium aestuariivivum]MCJ8189977.1 hypothetical protein [Sphingomicrobium aestuariivivum]